MGAVEVGEDYQGGSSRGMLWAEGELSEIWVASPGSRTLVMYQPVRKLGRDLYSNHVDVSERNQENEKVQGTTKCLREER